MGQQRNILLLLVMVLLLSACSHAAVRTGNGASSSLQNWVRNGLAPYLAEKFSQHPRFKGEPVIIVRLEGDDIQPDIDDVTRGLREQVVDSLLAVPGVSVPWQPQRQQQQHHRRLSQLQCGRRLEASYFIGIEITRTVNDRFRVSMRVLDVRAGEWVSGITRQWTGNLTASELRALQVRRTDESLRGLRVLPFHEGQPDLAASYLANNLSCLLRMQDVDDLQIKVDRRHSGATQLQALLGLVGNNLSRYREVQVTEDRRQANYILRGESHRIQPGLQQIWVILQPKDSGVHLPGMDTATYVRTVLAGKENSRQYKVHDSVRLPPAITRMELVRHTNGPGSQTDCDQQMQGCPLLEIDSASSSEMYVIAYGIKDGISRLSGSCEQVTTNMTQGRYVYRYPDERFASSDWPTLYAIAVRGAGPAQLLRELVQQLPDACSHTPGLADETDQRTAWMNRLDQLIAAHSDQTGWMARRVP